MSDFLNLQGAKDLNTDAIHIGAVANSVDPVTGAPIGTHVNRVGGTDYTLQGFWNALGPVIMPWTSVTGGALTQPNQAFLHPANGNYYSWGGAYPAGGYVVAPGADPAAIGSGYVLRTDAKLRSELSGLDGDGYTGYATYAQIRAYAGDKKSIRCGGRSVIHSNDGAHGVFIRDDADIVTEDDDCTVLVDTLSRRWKRVGVKDKVDVAWAGAIPNTPALDSTNPFKNAMKAVYRLSNTTVAEWPMTVRCALIGAGGDYYFSSGFITPDFSSPNFVNYDILMPDSTFRPLGTYDLRLPLIHAKACFEYTWAFGVFGFQSTTGATGTSYVIFNDSSREQNYGGKCTYKIKAGDTEYVIRHELESVVANFDHCMTNKNITRFLRVWRCDQAHINGGYFNWEQSGKSTYSSFIQWGLDDGATSETTYPGNGTYNAGRLTISNSMFVPNGTNVSMVHTGWIENVSGTVNITDTCHFGPESNNRPSIVLNRAIGATLSRQSDLTDCGIYIDGASCASSWDIVYCISDYPNVISIKNIRWNNLDYSNGVKLTYLIGGDAAVLNAKSSKYARSSRSLFRFHCDNGAPAWKAINDIDPALSFASAITTRAEVPFSLAPWVSLPNSTLYYDLQNRDGLMPAITNAGVYEITNTYSINSTSESKLITASSIHIMSLVKNGLNMELEVTQISAPRSSVIGATPSLVAVFLSPSNAEVSSVLKSSIDAGQSYSIRLKYLTNSVSNTFTEDGLRIRRIS